MTEESSRSSYDSEAFAILAHGTAAIDNQAARRGLGLGAEVEDDRFAQALVEHVAHASLPRLRDPALSQPVAASSDRPGGSSAANRASSPAPVPRPSFILRLPASTDSPGLSVKRVDDVRTLLLILRAGALFPRRAAVSRIGEILLGESVLAADARKRAIDALSERPFDLGYEGAKVLGALPGSEGRAARADLKQRQELAARVESEVLAFWDGEQSREPITELAAEERALLLTRARELSDVLIRHIAALIEDPGLSDAAERRVLVASLEYAGDPRLLPALRSLLFSQDAALFEPCVRALGRIEDARVGALLRDAYERATRSQERLTLAAALGCQGDSRGLSYVRSVLAERHSALLGQALEALAETGSKDDVQLAIELLEHDSPSVAHAAVRTLGRIGDGRALVPLADLRGRVQESALRGEIEEAEVAIAARAELLGEAAPSPQAVSLALDTRRMVARVRTRDPALVRARARLYHGFAYVWLVIGAVQRAVARFEAAAALRPGWLAPVLALALLYGRMQDVAPALSAFRRALDIDRAQLEGDSRAVTALAKAFLRRAEAMERAGRLDIARGLIEEVLSYDLRRANAEVRLALSERREAHRMRER